MTFSIVAVDKKTRTLGVATATGSTFVGNRVPHVERGVGAIATQGLTEISYGVKGLKLLETGYAPRDVLRRLLGSDPEKEHRQVMIIDVLGRKAAFTGEKNLDFKGHLLGRDYVIGGNMLASKKVTEEMAKAFEEGRGFAERLLLALEAGKEAGGDIRGERSAALMVAPHRIEGYLNLRVNDHRDPIRELRRLLKRR